MKAIHFFLSTKLEYYFINRIYFAQANFSIVKTYPTKNVLQFQFKFVRHRIKSTIQIYKFTLVRNYVDKGIN